MKLLLWHNNELELKLFYVWRFLMLKSKFFKASLFSLAMSISFVACGGGPDPVVDPTGPKEEVVLPGQVEAKKNDAMAVENKNHEIRKKIFEAKIKLGISTTEAEPKTEAVKK